MNKKNSPNLILIIIIACAAIYIGFIKFFLSGDIGTPESSVSAPKIEKAELKYINIDKTLKDQKFQELKFSGVKIPDLSSLPAGKEKLFNPE